MSRFSNRTARVVGYAAFAAVGGFAYLTYSPENQPQAVAPPRLIPTPELVSNAKYATELSAVLTHHRADDPLVNLAPLPHPAWQLDRSMAELQQLESRQLESLPRDYPAPQIRPMSAVRNEPREGDRPELQLPGLAPEPRSVASGQWHSWNADASLGGNRKMVPLNREAASLSPPVEVAASEAGAMPTDREMNWSDRGMVLLRNAGQSLLQRTVASADEAIDHSGPALAGYTVSKPVLDPPSLTAPAGRTQHFIDQPRPGR